MKRFSLVFFLLILSAFSLFSESVISEAILLEGTVAEPDFVFNMAHRRTYWVPVSGYGWLYDQVSGSPNRLEAPKQPPILRGKNESQETTFFMFKFLAPGDYYFHFYYQDFEPMLPGESYLDQELGLSTRVVWVHVIKDEQNRFSPKKEVEHTEKEQTPLESSPQSTLKAEATKPVNETKAGKEIKAPQSIQEHPLFPTAEEAEQLQASEDSFFAGYFQGADEHLFKLGLYYFSLETMNGMRKAERCFREIESSYPASEWASEAKERADAIHNSYFLIR